MTKQKNWLPGDPNSREVVERMLRVDHAGEYGAVRIYEGQLAVLGKSRHASTIRQMLDQEKKLLTNVPSYLIYINEVRDSGRSTM